VVTVTPLDDVADEAASNGLDDNTLLILEVAISAFVGTVILGLVGLLIYRKRSKGKVKSSSSLSHQSSSDEIRQEILTEAIE
jgi:hypothetical protein